MSLSQRRENSQKLPPPLSTKYCPQHETRKPSFSDDEKRCFAAYLQQFKDVVSDRDHLYNHINPIPKVHVNTNSSIIEEKTQFISCQFNYIPDNLFQFRRNACVENHFVKTKPFYTKEVLSRLQTSSPYPIRNCRASFTANQRRGLEDSFGTHEYIARDDRRLLATKLGLSEKQV